MPYAYASAERYPLVVLHSYGKSSFPKSTNSMVMFKVIELLWHNQRVNPINFHLTTIFLWFSHGFPMDCAAQVVLPPDPPGAARAARLLRLRRSLDRRKGDRRGEWMRLVDFSNEQMGEWVDLGKSTGNQRFSHEIYDFPIMFPLNQPIKWR